MSKTFEIGLGILGRTHGLVEIKASSFSKNKIMNIGGGVHFW